MRFVAIALVLVACKDGGSKPSTAASPEEASGAAADAPTAKIDAGPPDLGCRTADDCAISHWTSAGDCCARCEGGAPMRRDALAALERDHAVECATQTCERPACPEAKHLVPGCTDGRCVAIELPPARACAKDADCVLSHRAPGRCCPGCAPAVIAWHVDDLAEHESWWKAQCAASTCAAEPCDEGRGNRAARCVEGRCEASLR
jgi:hypothetical protein